MYFIHVVYILFHTGYTWVKVFSHDAAGGMFPSPDDDADEAKNFNDDDEDAYRYSILSKIENYRKDGLFHIRICYPSYEEECPCNEWTQSSNFVTENDVLIISHLGSPVSRAF